MDNKQVKKDFFQLYLDLDRRWLFLIVIILIALPLFRPLGFPVVVAENDEILGVFNTIEELPEGSSILIAADYDPASMPELQPMIETAICQSLRKKHKVILMTFWPNGLGMIELGLDKMKDVFYSEDGTTPRYEGLKPEYGKDYANLGYVPGSIVTNILAMGENFKKAIPKDSRGQSTNKLPVLERINSLRDIDFMIGIEAGEAGDAWVIDGQSRYKFKMALGGTGVVTPPYFAYKQAGQIVGIINAMKGAAKYEKLNMDKAKELNFPEKSPITMPGSATAGMDAQSIIHIAIILAIISTNVLLKFRKKAVR